ncbi:inorganic phosphate transporter [Brevibacterium aurantiacum]|uniref:Phosphate transporter n=1 Tax=Brevibacterium aurantiacum TaxID=273384 RepID=A0A1D7VZA6_BREAU|nr:inorganic phosphate transporter [Brevibacterium aurantiacum]AOP52101.1 putative low-affinity inorganic phosphate transporter [Brevibacterium aurantiacum]PCC52549.1 inorganic phosphate transporter [Brevibacterium aurantiacum]RCS98667.1 inorganic phosphate transporter [Brevibacterium aurantiacum]
MTQALASETFTPTQTVGRSNDRRWHLAFGLLLAISLIAFTLWSFGYVSQGAPRMVLITTIIFGAFMAFNIGGNDVANAFGTSVGAGTLTMKQALLVAAVFEVSGALLVGGEVTDTIKSGIVDLGAVSLDPMEFVYIMMAALLGAAVWLLIATRMGWPVSTTHSIIGGIIGASLTIGFVTGTGGFAMVQWSEVGMIAISWILSPALGGLVSFLIYGAIKKHVLGDALSQTLKPHMLAPTGGDNQAAEAEMGFDREAATSTDARIGSHSTLQRWVPLIAAGAAVVITAMLLFKGLRNLDLGISTVGGILVMAMIGLCVWMAVFVFAKTLRKQTVPRATYILFSWMQVFTASAFAFSHGSNDIANAIGPFAAVLDVLKTGTISSEATVPFAAMLTCGIALIAGLWFIGRKVIATVGTKLTEIHPASGFAAELAAAGVVMAASVSGLPVSSTHILIGAIIGVGLVNRSANWKLMKPIAMAWVITLPAAATIGAIGVLTLRTFFG